MIFSNKTKITFFKHYIFIVIFVLAGSLRSTTFANDNQQPSFEWKIGEELNYRVKWLSINVGTIKSQILEKDSLNGRLIYHC